MPNQVHGTLVHAMSGSELSRVRTELYRQPSFCVALSVPGGLPGQIGTTGRVAISCAGTGGFYAYQNGPASEIRSATFGSAFKRFIIDLLFDHFQRAAAEWITGRPRRIVRCIISCPISRTGSQIAAAIHRLP